jgi:hypothetical protein
LSGKNTSSKLEVIKMAVETNGTKAPDPKDLRRMEGEGPAGMVYAPVTERQRRAFAMMMGRSVLDKAVGPANAKAAELGEQTGANAPTPTGNGTAQSR